MDKNTLAVAKSYARSLLENAAIAGVDLSKYLKNFGGKLCQKNLKL